MAWVEKRGTGFRVRYRLADGSLHTENGFTTRQDAENRAADVESDQRRDRFVDPRLAQTSIDEWIDLWSQAHHVSPTTWATYESHIRNHILPRWTGTALGDIHRMLVKTWANNTLRATLADKSVQDILILFSMILGEAVDEGLIGTNPCRKLRLTFGARRERPHASAEDIDTLAHRMPADHGLLVITAAYTGLRWGELTGLQWASTHLTEDPRIQIDPNIGTLHELGGRLELGPPKTPAGIRTVHLPLFLADLLATHRGRNPSTQFVFTGTDGALLRRSNFRQRLWLPALAGDPDQGWSPLQPGLHFHDLRHTHKTWLIEDAVPPVLQHQRLGHKLPGVHGIYSHVTRTMIDAMLTALQTRWETTGTWNWAEHLGNRQPHHTVLPYCSHNTTKARRQQSTAGRLAAETGCGRYWDRTSDLFGVNSWRRGLMRSSAQVSHGGVVPLRLVRRPRLLYFAAVPVSVRSLACESWGIDVALSCGCGRPQPSASRWRCLLVYRFIATRLLHDDSSGWRFVIDPLVMVYHLEFMVILSFFRDYASTIAAIGAVFSAIAAWRSANRASASARESSRGLAMSLRPGLVVKEEYVDREPDGYAFLVQNVTPNPATNVSIRAVTDRQKVLLYYSGFRVPGDLPEHLEGEPWVKFRISRKTLQEIGEKFTLSITLRFTDHFKLQRWAQEVTTTYRPRTGDGIFEGPFWSEPIGGEISLNRKSDERWELLRYIWEQRRSSGIG